MDAVLIPAYEPDEQLIQLAKRLREKGFAVVVVDDGSGEAYRHIFTAVQENANVVTHEKNKGKGAALKTGMAYIRDHLPEIEQFITCDADGQHKVEDVERDSHMLQNGHKFVLTMRERKEDKIPFRSKFGNALSRVIYALLTKRYLNDNQSGLRGFACSHIEWMVQVEKDNYDYEMNVLYYAAKKGIRIATLPIEAIYIDNNQSSHFNPVKDTIRIYRSLFSLARGLFFGLIATELCVLLSMLFFGYDHLLYTIPSAGAISYLVNMIVSRWVFRKTRCYDYLTLLIHKIISYFMYTLGCMLFQFAFDEKVPLLLAFNIVFVLCVPLRYWLHKFTFIALRTHE